MNTKQLKKLEGKHIDGFIASSIYLDAIFTGGDITQDDLHFMYNVSPAYLRKCYMSLRQVMDFHREPWD
jgi:hypothetical protein